MSRPGDGTGETNYPLAQDGCTKICETTSFIGSRIICFGLLFVCA